MVGHSNTNLLMFTFLSQKLSGVLSWMTNKGRITQENIDEACKQVREALIEADVPLALVDTFLEEINKGIVGNKLQSSVNPGNYFVKIVHDKLLEFLGGKGAAPSTVFQIPSVVLVMGLQGSGKTTTLAKLGYWIVQQAQQRGKKRHILLASVDFYRPAAIDQLEILAQRAGIDFYRAAATNVIDATTEIYQKFKSGGYELLLLDTAGRLHIDSSMMDELKTVSKITNPKHKLLVLDAMTGQESLNIAKAFDEALGFESAILTKMDSETRGGAAFAFRYTLKKPIAWIGTGEKLEDFEAFIPERMTTRILGMGDLQTLLEKTQTSLVTHDQEKAAQRLMEGNFTLKDFAEQMSMVDKLGSLSTISRYLPGAQNVTPEMLEKGQTEMKRFKAIIGSMTPKERMVPTILDASRKKRVAIGSGVEVQDVNQLLQRFDQSKQFVKMFKNMGMLKRFFK